MFLFLLPCLTLSSERNERGEEEGERKSNKGEMGQGEEQEGSNPTGHLETKSLLLVCVLLTQGHVRR